MNLVDVVVVEVIKEPYLKEDGEWETIIKVGSWGTYWNETIVGTEKHVKLYKVGYKWLE
jgi:hypothetical protein